MELLKADEASKKTTKARFEKMEEVNECEKQHMGALIDTAATNGKDSVTLEYLSEPLENLLLCYGYSISKKYAYKSNHFNKFTIKW